MLLGADGSLADPVLVIDLDRLDGPPPRNDSRILVGICTRPVDPMLCEALDVAFGPNGQDAIRQMIRAEDPRSAAEALRERAAANPGAATILAALLRATGSLEVAHALEVESLAYSTLLAGPEFARWLRARPESMPPPDVADPVLVSRDGDELTITLNRPERRNAYGRQMRDALVEGLRLPGYDPGITRVVLDGAGPAFCAGGDLAEFGTAPDPVTAHLVRTRAGAALPLHRIAESVEVRVHGWCVGAGMELPAFAGRVVAAPDSRFRLPELSMGLIPGAGGTVGIPRRIGRWRTLYLALTGHDIDAATALDWGLVDEVVGLPVPERPIGFVAGSVPRTFFEPLPTGEPDAWM
jgi:enoyl-CoA hydratase/carnithine racemase